MQIYAIDELYDRWEDVFLLFYNEWTMGEQDRALHEELLRHTNGMLGLPRFYVAAIDNKLVGCYALLLNE